MNDLEITKENYKGYIELFKRKMNDTIMDEDYCQKNIRETIYGYSLVALPIFTILALPHIIVITSMGIVIIAIIAGVTLSTCHYKKKEKQSREEFQLLKLEYPDVENYNFCDLFRALGKANIIKYENETNIIDVKGYEDNLRYEEVKEKYLNEVEHNYFNTEICIINDETREKVKLKTKKYMNRGK